MENNYNIVEGRNAPIKTWSRGVPFDEKTIGQLQNLATLPFIYKWVAAMPDAHWGMGSTVGSVIATKGRDYSGGSRRRYWLRHGGSPNRFDGD